jgi:hypothetical protein
VNMLTPLPIPDRKSTRYLPLWVGLCSFLLYLYTLSKHYSEGEDSAQYVREVTSPTSARVLFFPNHLAFNILNRVVFVLCREAGYQGDATVTMQILNASAGALALAIMVKILQRLAVADRLTLCWVGVTAVSFGFWSYSTQAETYTLPIPSILACIYLIINLWDTHFSYATFAWLGCLGAVATLLHQQHVLVLSSIVIAVAIIGYRNRSDVPMRRVVLGLGILSSLGALLVGVAYIWVAIGVFHLYEPVAIIAWSKGHAGDGLWTPWSYTNPIKSLLIGFSHAVLGAHFLFGFDSFAEAVSRGLAGKVLLEERYLGQHIPLGIRLTCLAATICAMLSGLAVARSLLFRSDKERPDKTLEMRYHAADTIVLVLIIHYFIFNTLWEPTNIEFWIVPLPVVAIAIASMQSRRPNADRWWLAGAALATSLLVANGLGSILPQTRLDTDYWYQANRYLIQNARAGDVILTDGRFISNNYLKLYTGADVVSAVTWDNGHSADKLLDGGFNRIWVSSWAVEPPSRTGWMGKGRTYVANEEYVRGFVMSIRDRLSKRNESEFQTVWELTPRAPTAGTRKEGLYR